MYELNLYAEYRSIFVHKLRSRWDSCVLAKKFMLILRKVAHILPSATHAQQSTFPHITVFTSPCILPRYKPPFEDRGRCCATNRKVAGSIPAGVIRFFIDIKSFRSHYGPGVDSASNRNEYQEYFLGVKAAGA